jgi:hypothetical protein
MHNRGQRNALAVMRDQSTRSTASVKFKRSNASEEGVEARPRADAGRSRLRGVDLC